MIALTPFQQQLIAPSADPGDALMAEVYPGEVKIGINDLVDYQLPGNDDDTYYGQVEIIRADGQLKARSWNGNTRWVWDGNVAVFLKAAAIEGEDVNALLRWAAQGCERQPERLKRREG